MNELSTKQVSFLRSRAHSLEPRLNVGKKGVSDETHKTLDALLAKHELVKVRMGKLVQVDLPELAQAVNATLVHKVGRNAVFYRPGKEPVISLPGA